MAPREAQATAVFEVSGVPGRRLLADQKQLRARLADTHRTEVPAGARAIAALAEARNRGIAVDREPHT